MKIISIPIEDVIPYDRNPRHNDRAVDAVARSIEEFGFRQPIVVTEDYVIIAGHTRWKAALKLGLKTVPVHVAHGLTPEKIRAYRIADNKLSELAEGRGMLVDLDQSERVIAFSSKPVMVAEKEFERSGFLPDIVFPTGLVRREDHLLVYYGAADTATGVAQYALNDLLDSVTPS